MVLATLGRRAPVQRVEATTMPCSGQVSAWLKKTKSEGAKLKWLSKSNKRYFTIDFDSQVFFYAHTKDQKGLSEKVPFQDLISVEKMEFPAGAGKKPSDAQQGKSFKVATRGRTFELHASSPAEASQWVYALGVAKEQAQSKAPRPSSGNAEPAEVARPTLEATPLLNERPAYAQSPSSGAWSAQNMHGPESARASSSTDPSTGGSTTAPQPEKDEVDRPAVLPELDLTAAGNCNPLLQQAGEAGQNSARQPSSCGTPYASPARSPAAQAPASPFAALEKLEELAQPINEGVAEPEKPAEKQEEPQKPAEKPRQPQQEAEAPKAEGSVKPPAAADASAGSGPDLLGMPPPPPQSKKPPTTPEPSPPHSSPMPLVHQVSCPVPAQPPVQAAQPSKEDGNVGSGPDLSRMPPPPPPPPGAATAAPVPCASAQAEERPPMPARPAKLPPVSSPGCGPELMGLPPPPPPPKPYNGIGSGIPVRKPLQPTGSEAPQEVVSSSTASSSSKAPTTKAVASTPAEKREALWKWADQDGDGIMNRSEVERFVLATEGAPLHYQQYVQMCKIFGADPNVGLTSDQFRTMYDNGMSDINEDYQKVMAVAQQERPSPSPKDEEANRPKGDVSGMAIQAQPAQSEAMPQQAAKPEAAKVSSAAPKDSEVVEVEGDRVPCPHCGRRFAPEAAERHIPICQKAKAKPAREKRRAITATRAPSSSGLEAALPPKAPQASTAAPIGPGMGEEPSGWDSDDGAAKGSQGKTRVPEGPATGKEASGWDTEDETQVAGNGASTSPQKESSEDENKDPASAQARPKKLAPLALEFDMTTGPHKPVPKKLAERLSKKRSKKSKDKERHEGGSADALEPSGWDSDDDKGAGKAKGQKAEELDRPAFAGFVAASGKVSSGNAASSAPGEEGGLNDLLGELANTDTAAPSDSSYLVPDLLCTGCDRQVFCIENHIWNPSVTYMFLRNSYPNALTLSAQLTLKKGCRAYCCQCTSRSADSLAELADVANGLRWRVLKPGGAAEN